MQCDRCFSKFKSKLSLSTHRRYCDLTPEIEKEILKLYFKKFYSLREIEALGFKTRNVHEVLDGKIRPQQETRKLKIKNGRLKIKPMSKEARKNISKARIKFLKNNPDKAPYKIYHASNESYLEKKFKIVLKKNKITGWVYRYQNGIYEYDFAFPLKKIDIEIDGETHESEKVKKIDKKRDKWSKKQGWKVVRFKGNQIKHNLDECIKILKEYLENIEEIDIDNWIKKNVLFLRKSSERKEKLKKKEIEKRKREKYKQDKKLINQRLKDLKNIEFKHGTIKKLSDMWNVSHTQVRRYIKEDFPQYDISVKRNYNLSTSTSG